MVGLQLPLRSVSQATSKYAARMGAGVPVHLLAKLWVDPKPSEFFSRFLEWAVTQVPMENPCLSHYTQLLLIGRKVILVPGSQLAIYTSLRC